MRNEKAGVGRFETIRVHPSSGKSLQGNPGAIQGGVHFFDWLRLPALFSVPDSQFYQKAGGVRYIVSQRAAADHRALYRL